MTYATKGNYVYTILLYLVTEPKKYNIFIAQLKLLTMTKKIKNVTSLCQFGI